MSSQEVRYAAAKAKLLELNQKLEDQIKKQRQVVQGTSIQVAEQGKAAKLIEMDTSDVRKIAQALDRIRRGTYGYCLECREEISDARIKALPFALKCKDCAASAENLAQSSRRNVRQPLLEY